MGLTQKRLQEPLLPGAVVRCQRLMRNVLTGRTPAKMATSRTTPRPARGQLRNRRATCRRYYLLQSMVNTRAVVRQEGASACVRGHLVMPQHDTGVAGYSLAFAVNS